MASSSKAKHIALTGSPGVGKTTLVLKLCEKLKSNSIALRGFYTKEERDGRSRTGFTIVTMDGQTGPLASIEADEGYGKPKGPRVGNYTVKLQSFENLALPSLNIKDIKQSGKSRGHVLVIDEIGKMEMFSKSFESQVKNLLKDDITMLTTIPIAIGRPIPLVEQIRSSPDFQVYTVTRENRDSLLDEILGAILKRQSSLD